MKESRLLYKLGELEKKVEKLEKDRNDFLEYKNGVAMEFFRLGSQIRAIISLLIELNPEWASMEHINELVLAEATSFKSELDNATQITAQNNATAKMLETAQKETIVSPMKAMGDILK